MNAINSPMKAGIEEIYSLILHAFETLSGKKSESPFFRLFFSLSPFPLRRYPYAWEIVITKSDLSSLILSFTAFQCVYVCMCVCVWDNE